MKLAIDVGNTLSKIAVFDDEELISITTEKVLNEDAINRLLHQFKDISSVIIASVKADKHDFPALFPLDIPLIILDHNTRLPVEINYNTPETLGVDRIAAVVAANHMFQGKNTLVIESGTCITYDFVDAKGVYHGGSISPGMDLRYKALHNFTDNLPLIEPVKNASLSGKSTKESIQSGVYNGIIAEMQGFISMYEDNYENLTIILSGGNHDYFDKNLKNNIFAVPNIVLRGLNIILDFNDKN